ncbi:MAG: autotransporter-associated beta strand repeat-containing protein [Kiritimatiellae bacterium]|nr:autotransporter-associated beta strand repeat-containing protein [Kiritimatiellia bacterium]
MSAIRKYIVALSRYAAAAATVTTIAWASQTLGADGKWTNLAGGAWNTTGNWADGIVAGGTDAIADFSTLNLTAHASVSNDSPRTIGTLRFGDTTPSHNWTLTSSTLTLARGAGMPTIAVENQTATIASAVLGNQGLVKSGAGKLVLSGGINNNFSGPITVNNGILESYGGNSFKNTSGAISVAAGAVFNANGRFDGVAILNAINLSGNGVGAYGALNGQYNVNLTGPITLLTDTKITHDYNYFRISGPIVADGAGKNLELNVLVSGQYPIYVDGSMTLGTGTLTLNSVRNGGIGGGEFCAFDFKEANSYSGGTVLTNYATLRLRNAGALGSGGVTLYQGS